MDRHTAKDYVQANFEPSDRLAVVVLNKATNDVKQRIATTERISQDDFQRWLRWLNKEHYEIYVGMNPIREGAYGRTKTDIAEIRHVYLDFDNHGPEAVRQMMADSNAPTPNHLIESSPGKSQAIWRVRGFGPQQAEGLMRGMVQHFGADPAAVDTARVLRLPGFYNHKYPTPHFIRVENLSAEVHTPSHFPEFASQHGAGQQPEARTRKRAQGPITQSEKDWAYAMRALTRGEDPQEVIQAIAAFRTDKPDPHYYATHTVSKAAAVLSKTKQPQQGLSLAL
jgi:hypothetical protein